MGEPPKVVAVESRHLYQLATALSPAEIVGAVRAHDGSVEAAAKALGLDEDVVNAALKTEGLGGAAAADSAGGASPIAVFRDALGVLTAMGVLVYVLGGAVLAARLAFEELPGEAVFAQLPRDFLLATGVTQVLVPGLLVVVSYAIFRVFFGGGRDEVSARDVTVVGVLCWIGALLMTVTVADFKNGGAGLNWNDRGFWLISALVLFAVIACAARVRWEYGQKRLPWPNGPKWLTLALAYGVVAMVAAAIIAATFPLLQARACMTSGTAENGSLVGQNSDRVVLAEPTRTDRRLIASLPAAEVHELFIGDDAGGAECDPSGTANAGRATAAARSSSVLLSRSRRQLRRLLRARTPAAARDAAPPFLHALNDAQRHADDAIDAADRLALDSGAAELRFGVGETQEYADAAARTVRRFRRALDAASSAETGRRRALRSLYRLARQAQRRSNRTTSEAGKLAKRARALATAKAG